jgi:hypothetical protein
MTDGLSLVTNRMFFGASAKIRYIVEILLPRQESEQTCIRVLRVPVLEVFRQYGTVFFFVLFCVNITFLIGLIAVHVNTDI